MKLKEAINGLVGLTSNRLEVMSKLKEQYGFATTLAKYKPEDLEKMNWEKLIKIINVKVWMLITNNLMLMMRVVGI